MKKVILSMVIVLLTAVSACGQSENSKITEAVFEVCENQEIDNKTIKKATDKLKGVVKTVWDKKNKNIVVSYNENKITRMEICRVIMKSICDAETSKGKKLSLL